MGRPAGTSRSLQPTLAHASGANGAGPSPPAPRRRGRRIAIVGALALGAVAAALALMVLLFGRPSLAADAAALAHVDLPAGGEILAATASGPHGKAIPLTVRDGKLWPRTHLPTGERVAVDVEVERPGWIGWLLGKRADEHLALRTPTAHVRDSWLTLGHDAPLRIAFDAPARRLASGSGGSLHPVALASARTHVVLDRSPPPAGSVLVAAAPRSWERLPAPTRVRWFPSGHHSVALASPAPGAEISPATPLTLTFSEPVDQVLGSEKPQLSPAVAGHWTQPDSHTLVFRPSGMGFSLGADVGAALPKPVQVAEAGELEAATTTLHWTVRSGSTLRLQQLLAQLGYLPLDWSPSGKRVPKRLSAQANAAVDPPDGSFSWRFSNVPSQLHDLWDAGDANAITRGAIMAFQSTHDLTVDALAGPAVWEALIKDAIAGKRTSAPYDYVLVHRNVPQSLTLWENGKTIFTTPANTGVPAAPTELGTFPVYLRLETQTMTGTNPDGSHYSDPGIKWISYFNGGDAIHGFDRGSYGTPQSVGCVELPIPAAAKVFPHTPIGTLVTIAL